MEGSAAILTFTVRTCPEVVSWVLSLGPEAEVLGPESLRARVAKATRATAALYG
jgi:WYL domain